MKINSNQNNCSFKSRFEFVSFENMFHLSQAPNIKEVGTDLMKDSGDINGPKNLFAPGIGSCTMYAMTSFKLKSALMGHYNKSAQAVTSFVENFANRGRALVTGGNIDMGVDTFFRTDIEAFRDKLPTTIIWGQNDGYTNAFYDLGKDTWYINKVMQLRGVDSAASVEQIKNSYKIIHIANGDVVVIDGKPVNPKLLNQNDQAYSRY